MCRWKEGREKVKYFVKISTPSIVHFTQLFSIIWTIDSTLRTDNMLCIKAVKAFTRIQHCRMVYLEYFHVTKSNWHEYTDDLKYGDSHFRIFIYVIWSSWISCLLPILIVLSPSKKITIFVSYCFSKPTFTHIFGTKCPILMGYSAKFSSVQFIYFHHKHNIKIQYNLE